MLEYCKNRCKQPPQIGIVGVFSWYETFLHFVGWLVKLLTILHKHKIKITKIFNDLIL